jgi:hypothetical protein
VLRSKPTPKAPVALMLAGDTVLEYVEYRYEGKPALVYEPRDGWYRVGYLDGAALCMARPRRCRAFHQPR